MKIEYEIFDNITRELLDTIKCGDLIKCNTWGAPLRVKGVSENYFIMSRRAFGEYIYSICEKSQVEYSRNNFTEGFFRVGQDNYIFGSPHGYEWDNEENVKVYLEDLEESFKCGDSRLSERSAVNLKRIAIKRVA